MVAEWVPGWVLEGFRRVPEQVPERVLEQVPERVSGAGSRAFPQRLPERVPRSLRPKPLCQALQDAWSPKTRAYSVLCLMQS